MRTSPCPAAQPSVPCLHSVVGCSLVSDDSTMHTHVHLHMHKCIHIYAHHVRTCLRSPSCACGCTHSCSHKCTRMSIGSCIKCIKCTWMSTCTSCTDVHAMHGPINYAGAQFEVRPLHCRRFMRAHAQAHAHSCPPTASHECTWSGLAQLPGWQ